MGRLRKPGDLAWTTHGDVTAAEVKLLWQIATAAEISGALQGGLDAVVAHVNERRQFGRPLGSFQGVQHRLADCASKIQAARWLTLRAADSRAAVDAGAALGYAQSIATKVSYDLHQFMGAMGLKLEHQLHRFTYCAKLLRSELGGASNTPRATAQIVWPPAGP